MMGVQQEPQGSLFYVGINLDKRIRKGHPLRRITELIDFNLVYAEIVALYGSNGNVSVPPAVILKLMLLLVLYNLRSERELMETVPERLDWLWFLGYDLTWAPLRKTPVMVMKYRRGFSQVPYRIASGLPGTALA